MPNRHGSTAARSVFVIAACVYCGVFLAARQEDFRGRVVTVVDGDTIGVLRDGREIRIRLDGIDAPESGQDFWQQAKQFMSDTAFDRIVAVRGNEIDRFGRLIARVTLDGRDLSLAAVEAGFAWQFVRHSNDPILAAAEARARARRLGLWAQPDAIPPWDYHNPPSAR
jgi:endonuclease YncB( thermonuclease family)